MMLKEELQNTADEISGLLAADSFTDSIYPDILKDCVKAYPLRGGKRIRPALLLWSCGLAGGDPRKALHAAAAVEVFHNWTLVHDDIIDRDDLRRGIPTGHIQAAADAVKMFGVPPDAAASYGEAMAILAGDQMQAWAFDLMLRTPAEPALVIALARRMQNVLARELISGEALDVELELAGGDLISEHDIMRVIHGKTSALLVFCVQCGAAIAENDPGFSSPLQKDLADFADSLGLAFQLQDDLLGVFGDVKTFGKPLCSDFQEKKPTLLYREAKKRAPGDIDRFLGLPEYTSEHLAELRALLTDCGAAGRIRELAETYTNSALAALERLPQNRWNELLRGLAVMLLNRNV